MSDVEFAAQLAAVRAEIAPALPRNVEPRTVELAAFSAVGERDLALRVWRRARQAADDARRAIGRRLRARHGARHPGGWPLAALFVGALCAAVAAALGSGARFDPDDMATATAVLAGVAAMACVVVMIAARGRALNRAVIRIHGVVTVGLLVAAGFTMSRDAGDSTPVVIVAAVVGVVGFVVVLVARVRDAADTEAVDTAVNVGLAETLPEVEAVSLRLRSDVAVALGPERARRIVELRTATLAALAAEGIALETIDPHVPAGGVIIDALLATWVPEVMRDAI